MTQKIPTSPQWSGLLVFMALLLGASVLVVVIPISVPAVSIPTVVGTPTTQTAMRSDRPDIAPPAPRPGVMQATPQFADSVPMPLTNNFDSNQIVLGRQTYTQWCATCHGDRGQGLEEWRSSWDKQHQNCTKVGCHGRQHGEGGFTMLTIAPPLIGPNTLKPFPNALALYAYIRAAMPFQAPGSLGDDQYWAVTAYLADQRRANAQGKVLDETAALNVPLHP